MVSGDASHILQYKADMNNKQIVNAANNILKEGLKNISAGTADYTDGDGVRHFSECNCQRSQKHRNI